LGGFPEKPGLENNKLFLKKIDQKFVTRHLIIFVTNHVLTVSVQILKIKGQVVLPEILADRH